MSSDCFGYEAYAVFWWVHINAYWKRIKQSTKNKSIFYTILPNKVFDHPLITPSLWLD